MLTDQLTHLDENVGYMFSDISIEIRMEEKMSKESIMLSEIVKECRLVGLDAENAYRKTNVLLKLYRRINWFLRDKMNELHDITYESCFGDQETLSYLLNFAPDKELELFQKKAVEAMKTKVLLRLIDHAIENVRDYPDNGSLYYSIFHVTYLNKQKASETEILTQLHLERSTYYRKKKEGTYLLGLILFGCVMPDFLERIPIS